MQHTYESLICIKFANKWDKYKADRRCNICNAKCHQVLNENEFILLKYFFLICEVRYLFNVNNMRRPKIHIAGFLFSSRSSWQNRRTESTLNLLLYFSFKDDLLNPRDYVKVKDNYKEFQDGDDVCWSWRFGQFKMNACLTNRSENEKYGANDLFTNFILATKYNLNSFEE